MKQRISLDVVASIVDYAISINQLRPVDVSVADWVNNTRGVVSGFAA